MNSVEWSDTQDLLLALVQALKPLTESAVPISQVLSSRFFIPPINEEAGVRHPVRILTTLCSVQAQVAEWVGETAPKEERGIKPDAPLAKQAQSLIGQVQRAIGMLCQSTYLQHPETAPVKETLKALKPGLDQIVETVLAKKKILPGAPFLAETRPLMPGRKQKKKKFPWEKEEKDADTP